MKIAIVDKQSLVMLTSYEDAAPNQAKYGGPWGDPNQTIHVTIPAEYDIRAVTFEDYEGVIGAVEDEDIKAGLAQADAMAAVSAAIQGATGFGQRLMVKFAAENVLLGITQDGKTGEVLDKMAPVMAAMQSGSLYEAIARAKAIPQNQYDVKYVTHDRLYSFINEIETYLGIQLSL